MIHQYDTDFVSLDTNYNKMNNLFRGLLAGVGAWKLGGGCLGTVAVFIIIWLILGQCS
jgi:hypothetical protein